MKKPPRQPERTTIPLTLEQMKVLRVLIAKETTGYDRPEGMSSAELAAALDENRNSRTTAAFHYLLGRVEKPGFVISAAVVIEHGPYKTRQKYFQVTKEGVAAFRESIEFYREMADDSGLQFAFSGGSA